MKSLTLIMLLIGLSGCAGVAHNEDGSVNGFGRFVQGFNKSYHPNSQASYSQSVNCTSVRQGQIITTSCN